MERLQRVEFLIVHHTQRAYDFPAFVRFRHKFLRGWEEIGYHYLVGNGKCFTEDGEMYTGRPEEMQGAHALGYNNKSLAICLLGDLDREEPTEEQLVTVSLWLSEKQEQYGIPLEKIVGHRELPGVKKSCPERK